MPPLLFKLREETERLYKPQLFLIKQTTQTDNQAVFFFVVKPSLQKQRFDLCLSKAFRKTKQNEHPKDNQADNHAKERPTERRSGKTFFF